MNVPKAEEVPLEDLRPHPQNYRKHGDEQLRHVVESIRANGVYRNVVCARDGTLLAGHGVVEALRKMGVKSVPVVRLDVAPDSPAALKVLTGDNEIARLGEVDDRLLSELLRDVARAEESLLGTGFDEAQLAALVMVTRPASEIRDFDAAAAWVGMPEYDEGGNPAAVKLVISFPDEAAFKRFIEETKLRLDKSAVKGRTYSTRWPWTDRVDAASVRFEEPA